MTIKELDELCAYCKNMPIRDPSQIPLKKLCYLQTNPLDEKAKKANREKWWATNFIRPNTPFELAVLPLRDRLLSFGGQEVILAENEEDFKPIMGRGQLWVGDRVIMMKGAPNQCHRNSSYCWEANRDFPDGKVVLVTGYALWKDGYWRQHSWCVVRRNGCYMSTVIETTTKFLAYFGYVMTEEESWRFLYDNE